MRARVIPRSQCGAACKATPRGSRTAARLTQQTAAAPSVEYASNLQSWTTYLSLSHWARNLSGRECVARTVARMLREPNSRESITARRTGKPLRGCGRGGPSNAQRLEQVDLRIGNTRIGFGQCSFGFCRGALGIKQLEGLMSPSRCRAIAQFASPLKLVDLTQSLPTMNPACR